MRSDRDIQRTPRRPVRKEGDTDTPKTEQAADAPFANIPVSHREPTGAPYGRRDDRGADRPQDRGDRRPDRDSPYGARRDSDRPQQRFPTDRPPQRGYGDRPPPRRDEGRPPQRGAGDARRPFDDRPPQRAWSDRPPQRQDDRPRSFDRPNDQPRSFDRQDNRPRPYDRPDDRGRSFDRPQGRERSFDHPAERGFDRPQGGYAPRRDEPRRDERGPQRFDGPPGYRSERRPDAPYQGERRPEQRPDHRHEQRPEPWGQRPAQRSDRPGPAFRDDRHDDRRRVAPPQGDREAAFRRDDSRPPVRIPRAEYAPEGRSARNPEGVRLSKVLADRGVSSRREADDWIAAGWVKVDGVMAELGQRVLPTARIDIDPAAHQQQAQRVTILINKPIGYVSGQAEDGYEPASVLVTAANRWEEDPIRKPFHPGHARGLAPAGRLDIDSTGLLVLTQDGRIAKHLIGEDSTVEKEYLVRVEYQREGAFPEEDMKLLNHGLELDGVQLRPARVSWANEDQLRFVLREGRKRQIRRMCELVGLKVVGLKRVRIGSVVLGKLPAGQWRYLREDERF
jgi:23S rRNA pseudouridine2604 synthase